MSEIMAEYLSTLSSASVLRQVIALLAIVLITWPIQLLLRRILDKLYVRFVQTPWTNHLLSIVYQILWPLFARILSSLTITAFQDLAWQQELLSWGTAFITLWLLYRFTVALLGGITSPTQAEVLANKVILPLILTAALLQGLGLMDNILQWSISPQPDFKVTVGSILTGFIVVVVFFILSRGAEQYLERNFLPQILTGRSLTQALSRLTGYTVIIVGIIISLIIMGVDFTTLAVVAGGLSVGLGFGLQEIVSNFVSGFILMFERSIGRGDVLKIEETIGTVQQINVRSMIIKTRDNIELIVPNSKFLTETVTNLTRTENVVRIQLGVGVTYNTDPRQVEQVLLEAAQHPKVLDIPAPTVQFSDFGDSSLNFDLMVWTDDAARMIPIASDLRYNIWEALKAHNIEIPFPQRDLHLRSGVPWETLVQSDNGATKKK